MAARRQAEDSGRVGRHEAQELARSQIGGRGRRAQLLEDVEGAREARVGAESEASSLEEAVGRERAAEDREVAPRAPDDGGPGGKDARHVAVGQADAVDEDRSLVERAQLLEEPELRG